MNTAPSCGLPTHCRGGTKFPFARLSEPALPFLVLFGRGTRWWNVLHFVVMKSLRFRETNHENVRKKINYGVSNTWVMIPLIRLLHCSHLLSSPCFNIFLSVMKIFYQDKSHVDEQNKTSYPRVAVISAKNHKRQSVTAKREKSQTPKVLTAILTLPNLN